MAIVIINSFSVCNMTLDPFPFNQDKHTFNVPFSRLFGPNIPDGAPVTGSPELNLKLQCSLSPNINRQIKYTLKMINFDEYAFLEGQDPNTINFFRQVNGNGEVRLKFQLVMRNPGPNSFIARIKLIARDSAPGSGSDVNENIFIQPVIN